MHGQVICGDVWVGKVLGPRMEMAGAHAGG